MLAWGAVGYGGSILVQNAGITRTSVSHAALLIGATPVLVAVIAALRHRSVAPPVAWTGFAVSFAGVGLVAAGGEAAPASPATGWSWRRWVLGLVHRGPGPPAARPRPGRRDRRAVPGGGAHRLPVAAVTEGIPPAAAGAGPVLATAGLVLLGTLAAATLFAYGQARVSAETAGSFVNLEPLVGVAAGAAVFGDPVGIAQAAGAAAILTGIALGSLPLLGGPGHSRRVSASIAVLAETPRDQLPPPAVARLGIGPHQKNVLVRVVLRRLERTLTGEEANRCATASTPPAAPGMSTSGPRDRHRQGGRYPAHAVEVEGRR